MIGEAVAALPVKVREAMRNVVFLVDEKNNDELLGHYHGVPNTERGSSYFGVVPDQITIYRKAIEEEARETGEPISEVIRITVWHEVGHYLGFDEEGVERLEKAWQTKK